MLGCRTQRKIVGLCCCSHDAKISLNPFETAGLPDGFKTAGELAVALYLVKRGDRRRLRCSCVSRMTMSTVQPILKRSKMVLTPAMAISVACSGVMFFSV